MEYRANLLNIVMRESRTEKRICAHCGKEFKFLLCYAKRPGKPGTYCSRECRFVNQYGNNNPNISELAREMGVKAAKQYKQKEKHLALRKQVIDLLSPLGRHCSQCECDELTLLQINHLHGGGYARKESGVRLWRLVLKLKDEAKKYFDVRCALCNWLYALEKKEQLNTQ